MNSTAGDGWFRRRLMRLTPFEKWSMNSPSHARETEQTARALLKHIDLPPQPRCLEIGCGQGALARLLVQECDAQVLASDYDPSQVAVARKRLADLGGRVEFHVVDGRAIPFGDGRFDALFSFGVMHHIPSGWRQVIAEAARVLKPGGWFAFTDLVLPPRAGRWLSRLLPRQDFLGEAALQGCFAENSLSLKYCGPRPAILAGLMRYWSGVARESGTVRP